MRGARGARASVDRGPRGEARARGTIAGAHLMLDSLRLIAGMICIPSARYVHLQSAAFSRSIEHYVVDCERKTTAAIDCAQ
jgi:hypothetical protein